MKFVYPWLSLLLLIAPPVLWLVLRDNARRASALAVFAGPSTRAGTTARGGTPSPVGTPPAVGTRSAVGTPSPMGTALRRMLLIGTAAALIIAAMRPQWGLSDEDVSRRGRDIVVLLDVSLSMLASDSASGGDSATRFARARAALEQLRTRIENDAGHRLALVTFSGRSTLMSPLSADYDLFSARLALADPRKAPGPGTQLDLALANTLENFIDEAPGFVDLLVLSDGEDFGGSTPAASDTRTAAITAAAARGVRVHAVSIGDAGNDVVLSVLGDDGRRVTIEYQGRVVRTRAEPETLAALVAAADPQGGAGAFVDAGTDRVDLADWYDAHVAPAPRRLLSQSAQAQPGERFALPIGVALLLVGLHALLSFVAAGASLRTAGVTTEGPRRHGPALRFATSSGTPVVVFACVVAASAGLAGFSFLEPVSRALIDGNGAFSDGRFDEANAHYSRAVDIAPESASAAFSLGAARYRTFDLDGALTAFDRAQELSAPTTPEARSEVTSTLASRARYNVGVVHYQRAIAAISTPDEAVVELRAAVDAFRAALALDETNADATYNLSLGLMLMFEMETRAQPFRNDGTGNDPGGQQQNDTPEQNEDGGEEQEAERNPSASGSDASDDTSGLAGKATSGAGGQNAMTGAGERGQRPQPLSPSEAEQLLERVRLDTQASIDEASRHRMDRLRAGASGPFW